MTRLLKRLRRQELELQQKNVILAREALSCGMALDLLEAPLTKRRKNNLAAKKEEEAAAAASSQS
eukprot:CAMPEP_0172459556 /NCGR_PEP_ID=MMETSP1065-20121228/33213_1 /TAXON_ID=265537 /ORGANISM="Amphiprora paludosa, Strain CCMP125" /LENGTH=64 /DNA_ID=CAMNT_0013214289 /DNA_START=104 /DNA_END=298 /DNA_ORIENTATION=-